MTGVAAIHDPLSDIDSRSGDIGLLVQVSDFINRPAVDAHPNRKLRMVPQRFANFDGTQNRRFQTAEDERATVAGRQAQQFSLGFSRAKLLGTADDFAQFLNLRALLSRAQLGIAHDVDEEHVRDFESQFWFLIFSHAAYARTRFQISGTT